MKEDIKENFEEAEIVKDEKEKRFKWINMELIFFLILGFLLGIAIKTEALKRITVGFDDYKISSLKQGYNFAQIGKETEEQSAQAGDSEANSENQAESGNQENVNQ